MTQFAVPDADITTTGWVRSTGAGTWFSHINDGAGSPDGTFITSPTATVGNNTQPYRGGLSPITDPGAGGTWQLRIRCRMVAGTSENVQFALSDGTTLATISGIVANLLITGSFADYFVVLNSTQIAAVRAYAVSGTIDGLAVFVAGHSNVGTCSIAVSAFDLQVPDANTSYTQNCTTSLSLTGAIGRGIATVRTTSLSLTGSQAAKAIGKPRSTSLSLTGSQAAKNVGKPRATSLTLTGAVARQVTAVRSFTTGLTLTGAVGRSVVAVRAFTAALLLTASKSTQTARTRNQTTSLSLTGAVARTLAAGRAFTTSISLTGSQASKDVGAHRAGSLSLTGVMSRSFAITQRFTTALTLTGVSARAVVAARSFTTSLSLVAQGRVDMALSVFNRVTTGGAAIVKKLFFIFDD